MAVKAVNSWYIPVNHKPFMGKPQINVEIPKDLFKDFKGEILCHNMKFDYQVMSRHGLIIPNDKLWCTMMMSVYIDENHIPGHDLDTVLRIYVEEQKKKIEKKALEKLGWVHAPPEYMAMYAEPDVEHLPRLYEVLKDRSDPRHLKLWEDVDSKFMLLLDQIERQGILIDYDLCLATRDQLEARLEELRKLLGFDPAKSSQLHPKLFAEPPVGLGLTVPSRTPKTNAPQVKLEWLETQAHPTCALVYEYKKTAKQLSSYYQAYLSVTARDYARLHPNFKQHGTETGRLSCENPNLQQIPRDEYKDAYVKKLFLPESGRQLWEVDYRTIEYRLAAVYAESERLISLFESEGDFHQLVADDVTAKTGITISRQQAKMLNYLMGYGGGPNAIERKLRIPFKTAKTFHAGYKEANWEIFRKADEANGIAQRDMQIDMWFDRTRHFKWPSETRKAFNAVIQGGAFHIMKLAMLMLQEQGFSVSNTVHDSVWLNVDSEADVIEAQHVMSDWTKGVFGLTFSTDRKRLN